MTPDEKKMLTELADKISGTPAPPKDPEAEDLIRTRIGNRPDALYMMTQTVLIQNLALQQAQQQIQQLQSRAGTGSGSAPGGSFLGGAGSAPNYAPPANQGYGNPPQYPQSTPVYAQPNQGNAPSFLRGAAQTAAGVAAGALAFEGIRSLFSHPGYGNEQGFGGFGGGESVVNNYYDSPRDSFADPVSGNDPANLQLGDDRDSFNSSTDDDDSTVDAGYDGGSDNFDTGSDDNFS